MHVTPARLVKHLDAYSVPYRLESGYDSDRIDPYHGANDMQGVVLHHTAGRDSLKFCMGGTYPPTRNCHFLVARDGTVHVLSATGAYHAGAGGPWTFTRTITIPKDRGNSRLYGIEIESLGTSARIDGQADGMTEAQVQSVAVLCAALLDAMILGPRKLRVGRVIRHRDWAPTRKVDTRQDLTWWRDVIAIARRAGRTKGRPKVLAQVRAAITGFIAEHRNGHL
jgi:N-acetyl-anhydromuramyl-L-alanine amidase AmpD